MMRNIIGNAIPLAYIDFIKVNTSETFTIENQFNSYIYISSKW